MTQLTNEELKIQTALLFPTNGVGAISALDLRTQFDNVADSLPFKLLRNIAPDADDDVNNTGGNGATQIGDIWINELTNQAYLCLDNSIGAAIWANITSGGGGGGGVVDGTFGDITVTDGGLTWTINDSAVTLPKIQDIANNTVLGRLSESDGPVMELDASALFSLMGLSAIADSGNAADLTSGILPAARFDDTAHGNRSGGSLHAAVIAGGASGFMTGADKTKLNGIAVGATANSSDATLLNRANHTGTQAAATITGLATVATSGSASDLGTGTLPVGRLSFTKAQLDVIVSDDNVAYIDTAQNFTKSQGSTPVALTDATNITTDASLSNVFTVTLGGSRTLANPTNVVAGRTYAWIITQDGTGGHTLAYGSNFDFPGGTAPTIASGANDVSLITGIAISSSRILCAASVDFS